jgi:hypothetical protein
MGAGCLAYYAWVASVRPCLAACHWHLASRLSLARQVSPALSLPLRALALLLLLLHATLDSDGFFFPNSHAGNGAGGGAAYFFIHLEVWSGLNGNGWMPLAYCIF